MRINKYLSTCGVASRRKCEDIITSGSVTVNGLVVTDLAYQIDEKKDVVLVGKKQVQLEVSNVYYLLNKPKDVICAVSSKHKETTVVSLIKDEERRIFPVGRLDKDTEGLIFITNDGDFAYKLTHPKFEKTKTYEALLRGKVDDKDIKKLSKGVLIDGKLTCEARIELKKMIKGNSLLHITIREGRNRQIRRMCEIIAHPVLELKRISEGGVNLGELKTGEYRKLTKNEIKKLLEPTSERRALNKKTHIIKTEYTEDKSFKPKYKSNDKFSAMKSNKFTVKKRDK